MSSAVFPFHPKKWHFLRLSLLLPFSKKIILFTFTIFPLKFHLIDSSGYTHIYSNSKKKWKEHTTYPSKEKNSFISHISVNRIYKSLMRIHKRSFMDVDGRNMKKKILSSSVQLLKLMISNLQASLHLVCSTRIFGRVRSSRRVSGVARVRVAWVAVLC